jgi:hypothetical protein
MLTYHAPRRSVSESSATAKAIEDKAKRNLPTKGFDAEHVGNAASRQSPQLTIAPANTRKTNR